MSTIFDIRSLRLPHVSRKAVLAAALAMVLALTALFAGAQLYRKLTNTSVVAYFSETLALYPGDKVQIMGVRVGSIDKIEPTGDKMRVTFHYSNKYKVPANATVSILNPSLVASRTIQLSPPYTGGPVLKDGAVIPIERTQVPVEWDQLRDSINGILRQLGPTAQQPKGPFGDVIESAADSLAGKGKQVSETLNSLSRSTTISPSSPTCSPNPTTTWPTPLPGSTTCWPTHESS
jgi:phospholipid/cholesterol/gamma-HCH transport system substrate-binding protein